MDFNDDERERLARELDGADLSEIDSILDAAEARYIERVKRNEITIDATPRVTVSGQGRKIRGPKDEAIHDTLKAQGHSDDKINARLADLQRPAPPAPRAPGRRPSPAPDPRHVQWLIQNEDGESHATIAAGEQHVTADAVAKGIQRLRDRIRAHHRRGDLFIEGIALRYGVRLEIVARICQLDD